MTTLDVGQVALVEIQVRDLTTGALTDATVVVHATSPAGVVSTPTVVHGTTGHYSSAITLTEAGLWRWEAVISGTVVDYQDGTIVATAPGLDYAWVPQVTDVAAHVTTRTVEIGDSTGTQQKTFTTATVPTRQQVDGFIADAVAHVAATTGTVDASLFEMAREVAELRAAAYVEMAQPVEFKDQQKIDTLLAQSSLILERLAEANSVYSNVDLSGDGHLLPVWSYPTPATWGDMIL